MYEKLAEKFQSELCKTTNTLMQEIATLGSCIDRLETKHDKLSLAYNDLWKVHESLSESFLQFQP